jgi:hypothetical protein
VIWGKFEILGNKYLVGVGGVAGYAADLATTAFTELDRGYLLGTLQV